MIGRAFVCLAVASALALAVLPSMAQAKAERTVPRSGMETPDELSQRKTSVQQPAIVNAYGNLVVPMEPKPREKRLSPGAYGSYGNSGAPVRERPLPDEKDTKPLW